jgi:hypothetical protein
MQIPQNEICWNHGLRRCHPASGSSPALDSRGFVAPYVSLYLGLLIFELPFRENLSEGSVLFVEYFSCSTFGGGISNREFFKFVNSVKLLRILSKKFSL